MSKESSDGSIRTGCDSCIIFVDQISGEDERGQFYNVQTVEVLFTVAGYLFLTMYTIDNAQHQWRSSTCDGCVFWVR